ncbi:MAG: DUF2252 domain-containing protein [Anaerolineae bacterium]
MMLENVQTSEYASPAERAEIGKLRRAQVPRAAHAAWQPPANRRDPIDVLEESNEGRVADLIPIRYGRMSRSPFAFLRGSAALMAYDLATTPVSGIQVQACGDCHLANFGLFATPERNLIFDLNDFDETLPAPWEWDVKRLAASFVVCGRENGVSSVDCEASVRVLAQTYRARLREYSQMRVLDVWYARIDDKMLIDTAPTAEARARRERIATKARESVGEYLYPKIASVESGRPRINDQPPLIFHPADHLDEERVKAIMASYAATLAADRRKLLDRYRYADYAFKVVGVGSVGTRCFVVLFLAWDNDPLLLQIKEARASVLEPYAGPSEYGHHGERVVIGQRLTQAASDMFLGWTTGPAGTQFYVRQLRDMKFSVPLTNMTGKDLARYAAVCGWALARAHAKGGDAAQIVGYLGKSDAFDQALAKFAVAYADQTARDHAALLKAIESGRVQAVVDY